MLDIQQEYDSDILFDSPSEWDEDPFIEQKAAIGGDIVLEEEFAVQEQKKQERRALIYEKKTNMNKLTVVDDYKLLQQKRRAALDQWARDNGVLGGLPTKQGLKMIWSALKSGKSLVKSLDGVCTVSTWNKLKKEYPVLADMEEACLEYRRELLMDEVTKIADQPFRTRMGETARDRLMIDARMKEIDRIDKIKDVKLETEQQAKNKTGTMIPIQINVSYGTEEQSGNTITGNIQTDLAEEAS